MFFLGLLGTAAALGGSPGSRAGRADRPALDGRVWADSFLLWLVLTILRPEPAAALRLLLPVPSLR